MHVYWLSSTLYSAKYTDIFQILSAWTNQLETMCKIIGLRSNIECVYIYTCIYIWKIVYMKEFCCVSNYYKRNLINEMCGTCHGQTSRGPGSTYRNPAAWSANQAREVISQGIDAQAQCNKHSSLVYQKKERRMVEQYQLNVRSSHCR